MGGRYPDNGLNGLNDLFSVDQTVALVRTGNWAVTIQFRIVKSAVNFCFNQPLQTSTTTT